MTENVEAAGDAADPSDSAVTPGEVPAETSVPSGAEPDIAEAAAPEASPVAEAAAPVAGAGLAADVVEPAVAAASVPADVAPAPEASVAPAASAPAVVAATGAHQATGPTGKTRSPLGGWLLLIPTLGIYYLFWYFNINRELRDYDPAIKVSPGWAVVCLFIPVVGLVSIFNTGNRIRQAQATSGATVQASGLIGLLLSIVLALDIPYYSSELNKVWRAV